MYEIVAPNYIEPIIRQGIRDGSIKTDYPKELAEVMITLLNIWINPIIAKTSVDEMKQKLKFLGVLLHGIGIDILDDEITAQYLLYFERFTYKG
ncbi:MAG: TetR/AcrR family transcriptional regulator, partial [Clostridium sp.]